MTGTWWLSGSTNKTVVARSLAGWSTFWTTERQPGREDDKRRSPTRNLRGELRRVPFELRDRAVNLRDRAGQLTRPGGPPGRRA